MKDYKLAVEYVDPDVNAVPDALKGSVAVDGIQITACAPR